MPEISLLIMIILVVTSLLGLVLLTVKLTAVNKQIKQQKQLLLSLNKQSKMLRDQHILSTREYIEADNAAKALRTEQGLTQEKLNAVQLQLTRATEKLNATRQLVEKDFELERERIINKNKEALQLEVEELRKNSELPKLQKQISDTNAELETIRKSLITQQEKAMKEAEDENYAAFHSINLTSQEENDIRLIREFSPNLSNPQAFCKLEWTEYIQKKVQNLCKQLKAEKVSGIYRITNTKNKLCYVGQAIDIANRWKQHCKGGLGIATDVRTNKFYKALYNTGIQYFTFEILEVISDKEKMTERERYWIQYYESVKYGYNSKIG